MRILVADDEPQMTMVLEALLKREHYSVDVVSDGQEALDYGLAENYDCIILDIMMPKLDGLQALRELRANHIATPVLLLTAKSQVEDRVAGLYSGADDYLPKPFDNREFIARVRALTLRSCKYTPQHSHCRKCDPGLLHLWTEVRLFLRPAGQQGISAVYAADRAADLHGAVYGAYLGLRQPG